jgi:hypothetical protein
MTPLKGWIRFQRATLGDLWYRDASPFARTLYLHLAMLANFAPTTTRSGLQLKPGQLVTSWSALAEAMSYVERGRRVTPTLWKCRHTAALLAKAGVIAYVPAGRPAHTGLLVTLTEWALHAGESEVTADVETDVAAHRLRELPQHREKHGGSAESQPLTTDSESNGDGDPTAEDLAFRRRRQRFIEQCAETEREIKRVRAVERGEAVT